MLESAEAVQEKGLKGRAAEFIHETGDLFVNGLYEAVDRTVADIEPEFSGHIESEVEAVTSGLVRLYCANAVRASSSRPLKA